MDKGLRKFTLHGAKPPFEDDKQKQDAYREVFGSKLGSKVLQDILSEAGYFAPFIPQSRNPNNAEASLFDQGKKFVCHTVLNTMTVAVKEKNVEKTFTEGLTYYSDEGAEL